MFTLLTFHNSQIQRTQDSGTLDRYIYDLDNVGDLLVHGETTQESERITNAARVIVKLAESFRKK